MKIDINGTGKIENVYEDLRTLDITIASHLPNSYQLIESIDQRSKLFEHYYKNYIVGVLIDNKELRMKVRSNLQELFLTIKADLSEFKEFWAEHKDCEDGCKHRDSKLN
jgi:hypothetical protein